VSYYKIQITDREWDVIAVVEVTVLPVGLDELIHGQPVSFYDRRGNKFGFSAGEVTGYRADLIKEDS
jgi:hypothetical protein